MTWIRLMPWKSAAVLVVALALILLGGYLNGLRWDAKYQGQAKLYANERELLAEQLAGQERQYREIERRRREENERINQDAEQKLAAIESSRLAATARADGLQQQLGKVLAGRGATCDTIAAQQRKAKADAVLGEVFGRVFEFAGRVAAEADRNRVAGLACESAYESLRGN
ncbi:DUF2514 domain-containing protein [Pseudomonas sp. D1-3]